MSTPTVERNIELEEGYKIRVVDERVFNSEIKRLDSDISTIKEQGRQILNAIEKLETNMNSRFEKMDEKIDNNFKWLVGIYVPLTGVILAAFYAFAMVARN